MWDKLKEQFNLLKLEKKKLYLVTNSDKFLSKDIFVDATASALQGGVDIVQLNEYSIPDNVTVEIGRKFRTLCDEFGATYLVNNRVDIARITEADGVHLEQGSISIKDAKEILDDNAIIGKTVHNTQEAYTAAKEGADYLILRPVYINPSASETFDENCIYEVKKNIEIPIFLSCDITLNNVERIVQNNDIHKIVVTDSVMYAKVPELAARKFLTYL